MKKNKVVYSICLIGMMVLICIIFIVINNVKVQTNTTLEQLQNNGHSQMMGYIIKTDNDKVIVIDGGTSDDTTNLVSKKKLIIGLLHIHIKTMLHVLLTL